MSNLTQQDTIAGIIEEVMMSKLVFYGTYVGIVIDTNDEDKLGRVQVAMPDFSWMEKDNAPWAYPDRIGAIIPAVDDLVYVTFVGGDLTKVIYGGVANPEMANRTYNSYADPRTQIIFEDSLDQSPIVYNRDRGVFELGNEGLEPVPKGNQLKTVLDSIQKKLDALIGAYNTHTHVVPSGGSATNAPVPGVAQLGALDDVRSDKVEIQ